MQATDLGNELSVFTA